MRYSFLNIHYFLPFSTAMTYDNSVPQCFSHNCGCPRERDGRCRLRHFPLFTNTSAHVEVSPEVKKLIASILSMQFKPYNTIEALAMENKKKEQLIHTPNRIL